MEYVLTILVLEWDLDSAPFLIPMFPTRISVCKYSQGY